MGEFVDVEASVEGPSKGTVAEQSDVVTFDYDRYIQIPRSCGSVVLGVLERLSKMSASLQAKVVEVTSTADVVRFRYDNTYYRFEYAAPNLSGKVVSPFCVNIGHLKSFFSTASGSLVVVEECVGSDVRSKGFYALVGPSLVYLETQAYDGGFYSFNWADCTVELDASYLAGGLGLFTSLLGMGERAAEQQLISYNGDSFINLGVVLGKGASFWGSQDCIINRPMLECISLLVGNMSEGSVRACMEPKCMTVDFGGTAKLLFAYTTGAIVSRFVSPMFQNLFRCDSYVSFDKSELQRLLGVFGSLDYFKDLVTLEFMDSHVVLTPQVEGVKGMEYRFDFSGGSTGRGRLVVPVVVLAGVLSKVSETARYGCNGSVLVVDAGLFKYAIRSVMQV